MDDPGSLNARARWLSGVAAVIFAGLTARAVQVTVACGAGAPRRTAARRAPERGRILAAGGEVLAESVMGHEVDVERAALAASPSSIDRLAAILGCARPDELRARVAQAASGRVRVLRLRRGVEASVARAIRAARPGLAGVRVIDVPRRRYPQGELTAHPVGFMGDVDLTELTDAMGYRTGDRVGRAGVERSWELTLRGVSSHAPERRGVTLVTSLDLRLQRAAAEALGDEAGAVVALDPRDGRVLAYVSRPAVDPERFERDGAPDYSAPREFPDEPLLDRVSGVSAEVDNVLEPLRALNALAHGYALPAAHRCTHWSDDLSGSPPGIRLSFERALALDCTSYFFAALENHPGVPSSEEHASALRDLGFEGGTGIDLREEVAARVHMRSPTEAFYNFDPMFHGVVAVLATPLHVAVAYAAVANGGTVYQPRLVDRVLHPSGAVASQTQPVVRGRVAFPQGARERVLAAMRDAFQQNDWQALRSPPQIDVAGLRASHTWFVGLTPALTPRVVVVAWTPSSPRPPMARVGLAVIRAWQASQPSPEGSAP